MKALLKTYRPFSIKMGIWMQYSTHLWSRKIVPLCVFGIFGTGRICPSLEHLLVIMVI